MKILITGATGFIGRYVVEYLLSNNYSLVTTSIESKEDAIKLFPLLEETDYITKDLNEREDNYYGFFGKPDIVIHLSWQGLPNYFELFHIERNLPANYSFVKNLIQNGLKNITIAGTCFEYGLQNGCLNENAPALPNTMYGLAKDTLRRFVEALQLKYQFSMKWMRIFYPYGHGQGVKSLWSQMEQARISKQEQFNMSLGEQLRDYIPVSEVAEYISRAALQNEVTGIINCCSGKPVSVRSFVEQFFTERNSSIKLNLGYYPYLDYEPFAFWGDNTKLNCIISK
jgi:dTDP-6-deoxy-L-talose 4-dehydrogenase (NAD+)